MKRASPASDTSEGISGPVCTNCRKRKRKCSRGHPCTRCLHLNLRCVYETVPDSSKKARMQLEDIELRLEKLENIADRVKILESIVLNKPEPVIEPPKPLDTSESVSSAKSDLFDLSPIAQSNQIPCNGPPLEYPIFGDESGPSKYHLPSRDVMDQILDAYFKHVHAWVPILHPPTFRSTALAVERPPIIVLQAMVSVSVKFLRLPEEQTIYFTNECRKAALLASMDMFSVESLQASLILAFETTGCGKGPRSWSIAASTSRIVEQLGLSCEEDDTTRDRLLSPLGFLRPSNSAAEKEGRRRIFWAVFLLERFCSTTTGCNTSIDSSSIRRRLPMEGRPFAENENKDTRYFNISETAEMATDSDDLLGGYSYLVEATECLSKVVTFLLHERLVIDTLSDLNTWMNKFVSLNSMLLRWKASIPEKWRSLRPTARGLDENLALAHVTHDTSVLLLHHNLAYPPQELLVLGKWRQSVQICVSTAIEIATITEQFLRRVKIVVSPQFCFCAFIAGRTLLANTLFGMSSPEIEEKLIILIECLKTMATRWTANGLEKENLASKFAQQLQSAKNSRSEIDARKTVFDHDDSQAYDGGNAVSLTTPPVASLIQNQNDEKNGQFTGADIEGNGAPNTVSDLEVTSADLTFMKELSNINEPDYIFSWNDGLM